ncbi:MAG: M15 family metallopeptidase [Herbinix sp.]|nr:M15 family metallopeptidase [Herbinix sp.]
MRRRSLILYGILLFCVLAPGCSNRSIETTDELITQDYIMNIDEEDLLNEDVNMIINEEEHVDNNLIINEEEHMNNNPSVSEANQEKALAYNSMDFTVGSIINTAEYSREILDSLFSIEELDQRLIERITGKSYKEDTDIPYSDLRYIRLLHMGFDGLTHVGEMIVNKAIADDTIEIFKELYDIEYPIEKILLIDDYDADDLKSMADNNSSAFNYRFIEGTTRRSVHSDGRAIDINPLYNPYVRTVDGKQEVLPENGAEYVDRDKDNEYYIRKDDPCYKAFVSRGFTWGGEWKNSKDYQHFEKKTSN